MSFDALSPFASAGDGKRLELLNRELVTARKCRFYSSRLPERLDSLEALSQLPRMSAADIEEHGSSMVCVPGSEVARIVTLQTSGTLGRPKRVYFSRSDLERTVDFFDQGMRWMCSRGDRVGIFMPCSSPDGLGDLLCRGLERFGAVPLRFGMVSRAGDLVPSFLSERPEVVVGLPWQMRLLAIAAPQARVGTVLLSADYVPDAARAFFRETWGADVLCHYGMTETGLGGAVESHRHDGMYIRRDELYFEVTDPATGLPLPDGEEGELVITTLRREAMPLIRYRTGDLGCLRPDGSGRLDRVLSRLGSPLPLARAGRLCTLLEEELFCERRLLDYRIGWSRSRGALSITAFWSGGAADCESAVRAAVRRVFGEKIAENAEIITVPSRPDTAQCAYIAKRAPVLV